MRVFAAAVTFVFAGAAQEPRPARFEPTALVEGRVVDMRDEPVPMAEVWIAASRDPDQALVRTKTDALGFFVVRVPMQDGLTLRATAEGMMVGRGSARPGAGPQWIRLHDAATVTGVLRDRANRPVTRAVVRAILKARVMSPTQVVVDGTTDGEGRFTLTKVPLGLVEVVAFVPGQGLTRACQLIAHDTQLTLAPVDTPQTSLTIEVAGIPADRLASVGISLVPYLPPPWSRARFDARGLCRLEHLPDLEYEVRLGTNDFAFTPREIRVQPGRGPHTLKFTAEPTGSEQLLCPAVVRDPAGKPIAGVRFALGEHDAARRTEATSDGEGRLHFASLRSAGTKVIVESLDDAWVLDQEKSDGHFGFRDLRFSACHECVVAPSTTLELRAVPACSVTGLVLKADRQPAAFVSVQMQSDRGANTLPRWSTFAWATTDREGRYRFAALHHLRDDVRVLVESRDGAADGVPFALVRPGTKHAATDLQLAPAAVVEGIVRAADGKPASGVRVWLRDWDFGTRGQKSGSVIEVITDRQGRFRFAGVPQGGAWLQLLVNEETTTSRAVEPFDVEPGKTRSFELHTNNR